MIEIAIWMATKPFCPDRTRRLVAERMNDIGLDRL